MLLPPRSRRLPFSLLWVALALTVKVSATVIQVAPAPVGSPQGHGTPDSPFASIQMALDRAEAGDIVRLQAGVYHERVAFKNGGHHNMPVTLEGEPGAVIDGSYSEPIQWEPAFDIAPGVYSVIVGHRVRLVTVAGRSVTMLSDYNGRVTPGKAQYGPDWEYPALFKNGIAGSGWGGIRALAYNDGQTNRLLLRLHSPAVSPDTPLIGEGTSVPVDFDPRELDITIGPPPDQPIILIDGVDRCVVRGVTLRNAAGGVIIRNSLGSVIEDCVIGPVEEGITLAKGADRATLRFNEIFWAPYGENRPKAKDSWDMWLASKRGGWNDRHAIRIMGTLGGHQIHDNYLHHHWDGISVLPGSRGLDGGLRIHHNRLDTFVDDAMETAGAQEDCRWHDNLITGATCGIRIKAPDYGPLYLYRNILWNNKEDLRNFGEKNRIMRRNPETREWEVVVTDQGSPETLPAIVYIYHNTGTAAAAVVSNKVTGIGTPNYHYFNNLFWCEVWWRSSPKNQPSILPNWQGDHNVYVRRGQHPDWETAEAQAHSLGMDRNGAFVSGDPGFTDSSAGDYSLRADSVARARGVDLSSHFSEPLPGADPGYFAGSAPDAGALQYGQPFPEIPRSRASFNVPPAGSWPDDDRAVQ
jgi:hypothetical protein